MSKVEEIGKRGKLIYPLSPKGNIRNNFKLEAIIGTVIYRSVFAFFPLVYGTYLFFGSLWWIQSDSSRVNLLGFWLSILFGCLLLYLFLIMIINMIFMLTYHIKIYENGVLVRNRSYSLFFKRKFLFFDDIQKVEKDTIGTSLIITTINGEKYRQPKVFVRNFGFAYKLLIKKLSAAKEESEKEAEDFNLK